ncbi:MAG TPA: alpha/beta hydrolase [Steroidobacteraceae bacterium]|nr:alpha/beta hydrolase [Steroidobacteraceae bacterium]
MTDLVLLPGMDGTGELFAPLLAALGPDVATTVVRYPDRAATYDEHVAVARAELPRDRPYVLLGESFSGPVAVKLAAEAPRELRGLVLCASFLTCPNLLLRALRPLTPVASPKLVPAFVAHHSLLGPFATPALRELHRRALAHVSSRTLTARLRAMADVDVRDALRALDLPSLYLRGTRDRVVAGRFADDYLALARHGRIVDIDAPHFLLQARAREAAHELRGFLRAAAP